MAGTIFAPPLPGKSISQIYGIPSGQTITVAKPSGTVQSEKAGQSTPLIKKEPARQPSQEVNIAVSRSFAEKAAQISAEEFQKFGIPQKQPTQIKLTPLTKTATGEYITEEKRVSQLQEFFSKGRTAKEFSLGQQYGAITPISSEKKEFYKQIDVAQKKQSYEAALSLEKQRETLNIFGVSVPREFAEKPLETISLAGLSLLGSRKAKTDLALKFSGNVAKSEMLFYKPADEQKRVIAIKRAEELAIEVGASSLAFGAFAPSFISVAEKAGKIVYPAVKAFQVTGTGVFAATAGASSYAIYKGVQAKITGKTIPYEAVAEGLGFTIGATVPYTISTAFKIKQPSSEVITIKEKVTGIKTIDTIVKDGELFLGGTRAKVEKITFAESSQATRQLARDLGIRVLEGGYKSSEIITARYLGKKTDFISPTVAKAFKSYGLDLEGKAIIDFRGKVWSGGRANKFIGQIAETGYHKTSLGYTESDTGISYSVSRTNKLNVLGGRIFNYKVSEVGTSKTLVSAKGTKYPTKGFYRILERSVQPDRPKSGISKTSSSLIPFEPSSTAQAQTSAQSLEQSSFKSVGSKLISGSIQKVTTSQVKITSPLKSGRSQTSLSAVLPNLQKSKESLQPTAIMKRESTKNLLSPSFNFKQNDFKFQASLPAEKLSTKQASALGKTQTAQDIGFPGISVPSTAITPPTFNLPPSQPKPPIFPPLLPSLPGLPSIFGTKKKVKTDASKRKEYAPSLLGILSGKRISSKEASRQMAKGFTGVEIRYRVKK